jgi:predicted nuclease of predicted toxin-antitoxin system
MRFLLDENLSPKLSDLLRADGHDVRAIARSSLQGADDETLWRLGAEEERILITFDLDFPLSDRPSPLGLVLLRVHPRFPPQQVTDFVVSWLRTREPRDLVGRITVLTPGRDARVSNL